MGIPVNNPTFIYGDNQSVLWNTTVPESSLKKKSCAVAYHFCREGVARVEWLTAYVRTNLNPSNILTNQWALSRIELQRLKCYCIIYTLSTNHRDQITMLEGSILYQRTKYLMTITNIAKLIGERISVKVKIKTIYFL